ncbi:M29 family metallopeptidase [Flavisphingomonas formosensis]|uniref:leucyl aminopeptidase n=1 Tax=Flavisphingomonas formosensis TaxID=861534 RepID=UPI0012FB0B72|nr:leucyl aminopeptidase [Sphingomonas formosensis]
MVDSDLVATFKTELQLCGVKPGTTVAALSEGLVRQEYAQATLLASRELGADVFHVNLPPREGPSSAMVGNRPVVEMLKNADLVMDFMSLLFSHEQNEILASGTRMLMVQEPLHVLKALAPSKDLRRRVEFAGELLTNARELRFTSPTGTDISYKLNQYPVLTEYGYTDTPGRWDHWPSGFLLTSGDDDGVDGTVVLSPGDISMVFASYFTSPVTLTVKKGYVTDIAGDGLDANLLRGYIESFNDERAYGVSHIGWGLNEKATWHNLGLTRNALSPAMNGYPEIGVNALAFYGNVLFSLGPNTEVGGKNDTHCHIDLPMRNCSLSLDGQPIVERGRIVVEEMKVPGF